MLYIYTKHFLVPMPIEKVNINEQVRLYLQLILNKVRVGTYVNLLLFQQLILVPI